MLLNWIPACAGMTKAQMTKAQEYSRSSEKALHISTAIYRRVV
jgi:hypothetical protein